MQFQYGTYFHTPNSVFFKGIQREFVRGKTQRIHLARTHWNLEGKLLGTSMTDIMNQLENLQAAYAVDGEDAVMLDNFGAPTNFIVDTNQTVGGVRVTNPVSHEVLSGAHGVTYLRYSVGLTWDILWSANTDVLEFSETLAFTDNQGLPLQIERIPANGLPIIQNITQSSFFYATQSGSMKQSGPNPNPPGPTFPGLFRGTPDSHYVSPTAIQAIRGVPYEYGINWKYEFISISPFIGGSPNFR
jgi:hypothetical protein